MGLKMGRSGVVGGEESVEINCKYENNMIYTRCRGIFAIAACAGA
ncbi:MAG: hypothetical protein ACLTAF_09070 [Blautia coccoides]